MTQPDDKVTDPDQRPPGRAVDHYEDGARRALQLVRKQTPSRYRGIVDDVAREMGVTL